MSYIDENEVIDRIKEEISNMIMKIKEISEEAKEENWDLRAEIECGIMEIEKSMAVINYYKSKI